jgi:hypothetical protein
MAAKKTAKKAARKKAVERKPEESKGKNRTIYFPDRELLARVDALAASTGLRPNLILSRIISLALPGYEKNPALLIQQKS